MHCNSRAGPIPCYCGDVIAAVGISLGLLLSCRYVYFVIESRSEKKKEENEKTKRQRMVCPVGDDHERK